MRKRLILASSSPRRQKLLKQVGMAFTVKTANVDESTVKTDDPIEKVRQLAQLKGTYIPLAHDEVVLSADTVVSFRNKIFEKPKNEKEAYDMINMLSGEKHTVFTGIAIRSLNKKISFYTKTTVEFWPLTDKEITAYIQTDDPYDKAGGYGIQSLGALFVKQITGDYYNIVGLPISQVVRELSHFGIDVFHK